METTISTYKECNQQIKNKKYIFYLIFIYSLLPGVYKLLDSQFIMLFNLPIILLLLFKNRKIVYLQKFDIVSTLFFVWVMISIVIGFLNPYVDKMGLMMGVFISVIPLGGYFISRVISFDYFIQIIIKVALFHALLGIIMYPLFGMSEFVYKIFPLLRNFNADLCWGRMSSFSGSLGFGNLMMYAVISAFFYNKKFLPVLLMCLIFSAQRSSWVGGFFCVILFYLESVKVGNINKIVKFLIGSMVFIYLGYYIIADVLNIDLSFIATRFSGISGAGGERVNQWMNGVDNFINNPLGTGVGQVGQVAARYINNDNFNNVADGDFIRILSELGVFAGLYYLLLLFSFLSVILFTKLKTKFDKTVVALLGGCFIQMIGSNITEFYFNNFIYWIIIGYYFLLLNNKFCIKKCVLSKD